MIPPSSRRRTDVSIWLAAGALALAAIVVALLAQPAARASPYAGSVEASEPLSPAPGPRSLTSEAASESADRTALFARRLTAFRTVEGLLSRAVHGPQPALRAPVRFDVGRRARVAPGATPQDCLAQAVYYEARGEPAEGQAAVAQVVLNRTHSGRHPPDVCGVVFEGAARPGCQFSFACDPRLGARRPEAAAWRRAEAVAAEAMTTQGRPELSAALNYHADSVRPRWAATLERTAVIGRHIFYAASRPLIQAAARWTFAPPPPSAPTA